MSKMWNHLAIAILIVHCLFSSLYAVERYVPADYTTIQGAIDNCDNNDIVIVSPGTYYENINFRGKAITVSSENPADPNIVEGTVINANGTGSVVTFENGEGPDAVLTGLTITGGHGTLNVSLSNSIYWGAGIYCYRSLPTITGNIITANNASTGSGGAMGYGCGIGCYESDAIITRNIIKTNSGYAGGGILILRGSAKIISNLIYTNSASVGGGVVLLYGGELINNTVVSNGADGAGNVYAASDASGRCLILDNIICDATRGGGIYLGSPEDIEGTSYNDVWNNSGGDYINGNDRTGFNGNISQDPLFADAGIYDYHIRDDSTCINAGDPNYQQATGEKDFYGEARIYAGRVDIGAAEYADKARPIAEAGADQSVEAASFPKLVTLDGSASWDPNGNILTYHWKQISGAAVSLSDANKAQPSFNVFEVGTYIFELIVNNGRFNSFSDTVKIIVKNDAPTADAGDDQTFGSLPALITLDGSRSFDPEKGSLSYRWKQVSGWKVKLSDPNTAKPTFMPWPGIYVFELVVNDGLQDSKRDVVGIVVENHAPIAEAGPSRYVAADAITLDGTDSYDPDGYGALTYHWTQISGPPIEIAGADTRTPIISGFSQRRAFQKCDFELVVSDGDLTSQPDIVTVTIVPSFGSNVLRLTNPPFNPDKPTIVAFGGGDCLTGGGMTFGGIWNDEANWITVDSYTIYGPYGHMLIVYLSSVAPDYAQPIQTVGFSTGNVPAMETAWSINSDYGDPRYAVNRVSLLDAVCSNLWPKVSQFHARPVGGEQCWVDSYISNDPMFNIATYLPGALNIACIPNRTHSYPVQRYISSGLEYENDGFAAFAFLSVIGKGKNYQLNTDSRKYYFKIDSNEDMRFYDSSIYPGKILEPIRLLGPADGNTLDAVGALFGCEASENAVRYQLLFGSDLYRVMDYNVVCDSPNPPNEIIMELPFKKTWWTVRAYDQYGSTIYADPRLVKLPENRQPVADAGPDQTMYVWFDGKAKVMLDGSHSNDPDGDIVTYKWAWTMDANMCQANDMVTTIELPIGEHAIQLMVNDGQADSAPDDVSVRIAGPIKCDMKILPQTINRGSNQPHLQADIRLPNGITERDIDSTQELVLYPGDIRATKQKSNLTNEHGRQAASISIFFDKDAVLKAIPREGNAEIMIAGKLKSGQWFYSCDTIRIIGKK